MLGAVAMVFVGVVLMLVAGASCLFEDCIGIIIKLCLVGVIILCAPLLIPVFVIWWAMKEFMGQI